MTDMTRRNLMTGGTTLAGGALLAGNAQATPLSAKSEVGSAYAGRRALVTGAGRGIGRESALALARAGAQVGLLDIGDANAMPELGYPLASREDLEETSRLVRAAGGEGIVLVADVRDRGAMLRAVGDMEQRFGGIDIVAAIAGVGVPDDTFAHYDPGLWQAMWSVNLIGVANTVHAALPALRASTDARVVIVTSRAGRIGTGAPGYGTSKWAATGLAKNLAKELGPDNIRVNCVAPGTTDTDLPYYQNGFARNDEGRRRLSAVQTETEVLATGLLRPEGIAQVVLAAAGPAAAYSSGVTYDANGGTTANTSS